MDHITIPSKRGKGVLRRVEEVFDCWFESGSMPYAQCHYPFENKEVFERSFPGDFIAEGLDQTRGWSVPPPPPAPRHPSIHRSIIPSAPWLPSYLLANLHPSRYLPTYTHECMP